MIVHRDSGKIEHRSFPDICDYLTESDLLVLNDAKVIPARLMGNKYGGGAKVEVLLDKRIDERSWTAIARPAKRLREGTVIEFVPGFYAEVKRKNGDGTLELGFASVNGLEADIADHGAVPLPPYINTSEPESYRERYQTVYANSPGATAAPTAGLHFTKKLLSEIPSRKTFVTLYTGYGTFSPVRTDDITQHKMHSERYEISDKSIKAIKAVKEGKGRIVAVGTTSARVLESVSAPGKGETDIFIYPGYKFNVVDALVTNFHLPKSTLLMLVSAFAGVDLIKKAYDEAVSSGYRFFSFGDVMLIL